MKKIHPEVFCDLTSRGLDDGNRRYLIMKLDAPDNYMVEQGEGAVSTGRLKTSGLATCVGLTITQDEKIMLAHIDANAGVMASLVFFISQNIDTSRPSKVTLINGVESRFFNDGWSGRASEICHNALKAAGISSPIEYAVVPGGFMTTVTVDNGHKIAYEGMLVNKAIALPPRPKGVADRVIRFISNLRFYSL